MTAKQAELASRYGVAVPHPEDLTIPPPELFPDRPSWIVRQDGCARVLDVASWGFPTQVRGASGKLLEKSVTNVRNLSSPFWRSALDNPERRCLVPFTSFSEYGPGPKGGKPLFWFDVPSRPIVSFAGIWRPLGEGHREWQLGYMLGVRRQSVTDALHFLEGGGAIKSSRGKLVVRDRVRLETLATDTYGFAEAEYRRLIGMMCGPDNRTGS